MVLSEIKKTNITPTSAYIHQITGHLEVSNFLIMPQQLQEYAIIRDIDTESLDILDSSFILYWLNMYKQLITSSIGLFANNPEAKSKEHK